MRPLDARRWPACGRTGAISAALTLCAGTAAAQTASARSDVVYDFVATPPHNESLAERAVAESLLQRFAHPTARTGTHCDPNTSDTPAGERVGGTLMPTVTTAAGSFTREGATETAYLIDYCATGVGQPSLRRLLVLAGNAVIFDARVADAERVLLARDVDGDGRDELLLLRHTYAAGRVGVVAQLVAIETNRIVPRGRWEALRECGGDGTRRTGVRLVRVAAGRGFALRAEPVSAVCASPPARP